MTRDESACVYSHCADAVFMFIVSIFMLSDCAHVCVHIVSMFECSHCVHFCVFTNLHDGESISNHSSHTGHRFLSIGEDDIFGWPQF